MHLGKGVHVCSTCPYLVYDVCVYCFTCLSLYASRFMENSPSPTVCLYRRSLRCSMKQWCCSFTVWVQTEGMSLTTSQSRFCLLILSPSISEMGVNCRRELTLFTTCTHAAGVMDWTQTPALKYVNKVFFYDSEEQHEWVFFPFPLSQTCFP